MVFDACREQSFVVCEYYKDPTKVHLEALLTRAKERIVLTNSTESFATSFSLNLLRLLSNHMIEELKINFVGEVGLRGLILKRLNLIYKRS